MKSFLLSLIELAYLAFQFPRELSVYMDRMPGARVLEAVVLFIASTSFATGVYQMRDYYSQFYLLHISVISSVIFVFMSLYFIFVSSYFDTMAVSRKSISNPGKAVQGRAILFLSSFPFWFFHPVAMLISAVNVSGAFLLLAFVLILFWSLHIQTRGLQYLYEITWKVFFTSYLKSTAAAVLFPAVAIAALMITGLLV